MAKVIEKVNPEKRKKNVVSSFIITSHILRAGNHGSTYSIRVASWCAYGFARWVAGVIGFAKQWE